MYILFLLQARGRASLEVFTEPRNLKELHHPDIVILTLLKGRDILRVLFDRLFMIQEEVLLLLKLISETLTDISIEQSISWLLREHILDNIFSVVEKQKFQLEMSYQLTGFLKVQPSATLNHQLVIKDPIQDVRELMQPLSDIQKMVQEQELDCHQVQEKPSQEIAEQLLVSLLEEGETKSRS